jgi:hypothetical protein
MNRLCTDHSNGMVLANDDLLSREMTRVNAANCFKLKKTVLIIMHDHEADLVHVSIEQNTQRLFASSIFPNKHTSKRIHFYFISVGIYFFQDNTPHLAFIARDGHCIAQFFKQFYLRLTD